MWAARVRARRFGSRREEPSAFGSAQAAVLNASVMRESSVVDMSCARDLDMSRPVIGIVGSTCRRCRCSGIGPAEDSGIEAKRSLTCRARSPSSRTMPSHNAVKGWRERPRHRCSWYPRTVNGVRSLLPSCARPRDQRLVITHRGNVFCCDRLST